MTTDQLREAIEQLEREGYVLCKKEPVVKVMFFDEVGLKHDIHLPEPLYAAAPAYSGGE